MIPAVVVRIEYLSSMKIINAWGHISNNELYMDCTPITVCVYEYVSYNVHRDNYKINMVYPLGSGYIYGNSHLLTVKYIQCYS